ncbi:17454_t:CDS:2 [Dentiscutata heterogama]|uniref:17454_t:CDS:1 n=1 Tax=Dentiscutata heterogama TaxID=1316150 RepID=A0ACA9L9P0_9GLOM|nr:17454_t:CDS:2 [Dentiscutata heterogama]
MHVMEIMNIHMIEIIDMQRNFWNTRTLESENTDLKVKNTAFESENTNLKVENVELKSRNAALEENNADLKSRNSAFEQSNVDLKSRNSALEQDNVELKSRNVILGEINLDLITKLIVIEKEPSKKEIEKERQASERTIAELKTRLTPLKMKMHFKKSLKDLNMQKMKDNKISQKRLDTIMKLKQNYQEQQELLEKLRKEENAKKYESIMRDVNEAINECNGGC